MFFDQDRFGGAACVALGLLLVFTLWAIGPAAEPHRPEAQAMWAAGALL